jgi:pSer/pThr/pTyr-binding forkhead associated (FHA) protein
MVPAIPTVETGTVRDRSSVVLLEVHPRRGRLWRLDAGAVLGRARDCEVLLRDPMASRHHARVLTSVLGAGIEDLGSANGVYVNARRRHGITQLHPRDVVQIGGTLWVVVRLD